MGRKINVRTITLFPWQSASKKAHTPEGARLFFNADWFQRERRRDPAFLAVARLRVPAPRAFVVRVAAREALPVLFLPQPATADVAAFAPRPAKLAVLRTALRTGLVTPMSSESDRRLLRLNMANMLPRDGLLIGAHAKRLPLRRGSVMLRCAGGYCRQING